VFFSEDVRFFFDAINFGFFEIYGISARDKREGGLSQCGHFSDKGEGVKFLRFCTDVLHERTLTKNYFLISFCNLLNHCLVLLRYLIDIL